MELCGWTVGVGMLLIMKAQWICARRLAIQKAFLSIQSVVRDLMRQVNIKTRKQKDRF